MSISSPAFFSAYEVAREDDEVASETPLGLAESLLEDDSPFAEEGEKEEEEEEEYDENGEDDDDVMKEAFRQFFSQVLQITILVL